MSALLRYQRFLLILLGGTLVLGLVLNTSVDPWRVTPSLWTSESLEPHRAIGNTWNRTAKAGLVRSGTWDAAIFGSSRVDIALDPHHPLFEDMRCVNLGLNAADITENRAAFDYFMDHQHPLLVVFALDAGDLTTPVRTVNRTDFALSPLDPDADPVERELRYHFGVSTMAASFETLGRSLRKKPADHSPQGFRAEAEFPENPRALIARLYLATITRMTQRRIELGGTDPAKLAALRHIVDRCRREGVRLVLLLTPNHALFQAAARELGDPDPFFATDRAVLASHRGDGVEVWDFLDGHPLNLEPLPPADEPGARFDNWIDLFHATSDIGDLMLDRIQGAPGDYGAPLQPGMAKPRAAATGEAIDAYLEAHPEDLRFLRESLEAFRPKP